LDVEGEGAVSPVKESRGVFGPRFVDCGLTASIRMGCLWRSFHGAVLTAYRSMPLSENTSLRVEVG